jgi:hypothetical protein
MNFYPIDLSLHKDEQELDGVDINSIITNVTWEDVLPAYVPEYFHIVMVF